jgi:hypothetical protein
MRVFSRRVLLPREDLAVLAGRADLLAIADAIQATQRVPFRPPHDDRRRWTAPRNSHHVALAFVGGAALFVAITSVALAGAFGLFEGTPAPPVVQQKFALWEQVAGWVMNPSTGRLGPPPAPAAGSPSVDVSRAHGVLEVRLGDGLAAYYMWAAPLTSGDGECALLSHTDATGATIGNAGGSGYSWCVRSGSSSDPRTWGSFGPATTTGAPSIRVSPGVAPGASSVEVTFADGTTMQTPVVEGFFLIPLHGQPGSLGSDPTKLVSYDTQGSIVGETDYSPVPLPPPQPTTSAATTQTGEESSTHPTIAPANAAMHR